MKIDSISKFSIVMEGGLSDASATIDTVETLSDSVRQVISGFRESEQSKFKAMFGFDEKV